MRGLLARVARRSTLPRWPAPAPAQGPRPARPPPAPGNTTWPLTTVASTAGRSERVAGARRTLRAWGSVSAGALGPESAWALPQAPAAPGLAVQVPPGTERMRVAFRLHGPERLRVGLVGPGGRVEVRESQGGAEVAFDVVLPEPGAWVLEAALAQPALLRCWAAQADLEPA